MSTVALPSLVPPGIFGFQRIPGQNPSRSLEVVLRGKETLRRILTPSRSAKATTKSTPRRQRGNVFGVVAMVLARSVGSSGCSITLHGGHYTQRLGFGVLQVTMVQEVTWQITYPLHRGLCGGNPWCTADFLKKVNTDIPLGAWSDSLSNAGDVNDLKDQLNIIYLFHNTHDRGQAHNIDCLWWNVTWSNDTDWGWSAHPEVGDCRAGRFISL